jgi:hypothetical protein
LAVWKAAWRAVVMAVRTAATSVVRLADCWDAQMAERWAGGSAHC